MVPRPARLVSAERAPNSTTSANRKETTAPARAEAHTTSKSRPTSIDASTTGLALRREGLALADAARHRHGERDEEHRADHDRARRPVAEQMNDEIRDRAHERGGGQREDPGDDDVAG